MHGPGQEEELPPAWKYYRQIKHEDRGHTHRRKLLSAVAKILANMHDAGVYYKELQPDDILLREDEPLLSNLQRARPAKVTGRRRYKNLAQLNCELAEDMTRTEKLRFLKNYLKQSNVSGSPREWMHAIERRSRRQAKKRNASRDRLITGNNAYFARLKLTKGWRGHAMRKPCCSPQWSQLNGIVIEPEQWERLLSLPQSLLDAEAEVVKECGVSTVVRRRINLGGRHLDVYVKRPKRKKRWKVLIDCFRLSRSVRAFRLGWKLLNRRIGTAVPLAAAERRIGPVLLDSILITEAVDAPALDMFLQENLDNEPVGNKRVIDDRRRSIAQDVLAQMGRLLRRLYENHFSHRDLKASNMLIHYSGHTTPQIVLIDLDGLSRRRLLTARRRFQGLMRLNVSLLKCPTVNHAGRLRMLISYLRRPDSGRINFKPYWRALERWSSRKITRQIRSRKKDAAERQQTIDSGTGNAT